MLRQVILILTAAGLAFAGDAKFDSILYGVSYYHEYMPYERLEKDVELMEQAGLTVVRLGESTWSSWEPRPGEFDSAWMHRIVDRLHEAGIKVIMGTPTYSIPPWLYKKHPEILLSHLGPINPLGGDRMQPTYYSSREGGGYGVRQNMDLTHPAYRYYAERVIRYVASEFAGHPAVIGFQVDNETHSNPSDSASMHSDWTDYLKRKFKTVANLNRIWGFAYWGQLVSGWDDLPPRKGIINPGYKLEWARYMQQTVTDFLGWQAKIVREYSRPDQFVTHNWPGGLRTAVDQFAVARHLDVVAVNPYHHVQDRLDGWAIRFSGDITRSQKRQNYLVTETNAQTIGWSSRTQFPPWDGQLRLNAYSHVAAGANMVAYWHWHSLHYGQETYWKGLLSHDLKPNRLYKEATQIASEFQKIGPRIVNFEPANDVAILVSLDSLHALRSMPFDDRVNYNTILNQMHRALYDSNIGVDFLWPESTGWSRYKAILVPPLYSASDDLLRRLSEYVATGGHVVMSFKSGFTNEHATVRWEMAPGPLREAAGFHYQEFSSLAEPLALKGDPFEAGGANQVSVWAEMLIPDTAETLASYDHHFFGDYPAITRNRHGKGTLTYAGTHLSDDLQRKLILQTLAETGIDSPPLPDSVRLSQGVSNAGRTMRFYLNYSGAEQNFNNPGATATDLITGATVAPNSPVNLAPWSLAILEEK